MRECRKLAEQLTLGEVRPREYSEVLLTLRDMGDSGAGESLKLGKQDQEWLTITAEALRIEPGATILHELGADKDNR